MFFTGSDHGRCLCPRITWILSQPDTAGATLDIVNAVPGCVIRTQVLQDGVYDWDRIGLTQQQEAVQ